jgi:hypothetical protein
MRRWTTPAIVAGVVAVAVLAAADALRGHGETTTTAEAPTITRAAPPTLRDVLRREAVSGFVLYSDDQCRLHSLLLPSMEDATVQQEGGDVVERCRFEVGAGRILGEGELMSPDRTSIAACRAGKIEVRDANSGARLRTIRGCPPAWRPDGRLTYPEGDRIMEDGRILFSAHDLRAAAHLHPNVARIVNPVPLFVHATDLAWLDEEHLVATLEIRIQGVETQDLAVLFSGRDVVGVAVGRGPGLGGWLVSPAGSFAASGNGTIFRRDGGSTEPPPNLPDGRAATFSPDEQWLAYVTSSSLYLIGTPRNGEPGRVIRLPIGAQDLAWGPAGAGATGTTTASR